MSGERSSLALLARQMWLTDQERVGCDSAQAVEEWDGDRLLSSVYDEYLAVAQEAINERDLNRALAKASGELTHTDQRYRHEAYRND